MVNKVRVLIAQSNERISNSLKKELLNYPDIEVVGTSTDGIETLNLLEGLNPDILIMDIIMPQMDGLNVLENLEDVDKDYKIIMYSAISNENIISKSLSLGADYYMIQTLNKSESDVKSIISKIKILLSKSDIQNDNIDRDSFYEKKVTIKNKNELIQEISYMLQKAGIPPHIKGYQYLRMCIYEVMINIEILSAITKELYPKVAERYLTTPSGVERAIRHSLEMAWAKGNMIEMFEEEGIIYEEEVIKPTNKEFILLISEKMRLNNI